MWNSLTAGGNFDALDCTRQKKINRQAIRVRVAASITGR